MRKREFVKLIGDKIVNMGTKNVYHPRRLKPAWLKLESQQDKIMFLERQLSKKKPSDGFLRLVHHNLCHKTLESIFIEHPSCEKYLTIKDVRQKCIDRLSLSENGRLYLASKNISINT